MEQETKQPGSLSQAAVPLSSSSLNISCKDKDQDDNQNEEATPRLSEKEDFSPDSDTSVDNTSQTLVDGKQFIDDDQDIENQRDGANKNVMFGEIKFYGRKSRSGSNISDENQKSKMILEDFYRSVDDGYADCMEKIVSLYNLDVNVVFSGHLEFIKRKHRGWCAIHIAASHADLKLIRYLLSEGSNVEAVTPEGETALHVAAKHGAADVVAALLECNVFLRDQQNNQGVTALLKTIFNTQHAFKGNYRRCVQLLLDYGCDPNISSSSKVTALHVAVNKGDSCLVSKLIEGGANVNAVCGDDQKVSPLHNALVSKNVNSEIVSKLVDSGADTSFMLNGRSMLHIAVSRCDDRIIESFLSSGADPNFQDQSGTTPLWLAVEENNLTVVPILLHGGGNINYVREPQCISLLSQAVMNNSLPMVKLLLEWGATTHTETFMWSTPLHIAVDEQNLGIVRELLRANCPLNTTSNAKYAFRPMTPIQIAMEHGNSEMISLMMIAGCKVQWSWIRQDRISLALSSKPETVHKIQTFLADIPSLLHLSRLKLREYMGNRFSLVMENLQKETIIPQKISDYLLLSDILG